ncbi:MAG: hypothetical protein M1522_08780 [Actinobacteria bacterium]|jgi:hypothetical protein|nr:hypothetical protein [Actinomycetota bacterium]
MLFLTAVPQSIQEGLDTMAYVGLALMLGAFAAGIVAFSLARSRGYLGAGITGSRRMFAALLGIFALGAINVIVGFVASHI